MATTRKTALRHCSLRVVALLETAAGYRHDARRFVGEIDLIGKPRARRRGPRRLAAWLLARGRSLGLPRCEFGLMLGLLAREAFFAARLDLARPSDAAVLHADKITKFASSVRFAISVAVSKPSFF